MKMITRRHLLSCIAASPAFAAMSSALASDVMIRRVTPGMKLGGVYGQLAGLGPFGDPTVIRINIGEYGRFLVSAPKGVSDPRPVVFSHNILDAPDNYVQILSHWSSHGYLVIAPTHNDSVLINGQEANIKDFGEDYWDIDGLKNQAAVWRQRMTEVENAVSALSVLNKQTGMRIPTDRVVLAGHGFGAFAGLLAIGASPLLSDQTRFSEPLEQIYAALLMAPPSLDVMGLDELAFSSINRPFLSFVEERKKKNQVLDVEAQTAAFNFAPEGNKHMVRLKEGSSGSYNGNLARPGTNEELVYEDIKVATTLFLHAYAGYNAGALEVLASREITYKSDGRAEIFYR